MNILLRLTIRHLKCNKKRTLITILGIALSVAMVTAISGMVVSFQDMLYRDSVVREGLWHVRYSGLSSALAEQVTQEPVFSEYAMAATEDGLELSLQFDQVNRRIFDVSEEVCIRLGIAPEQVRYHNNLLIAMGVVPGPYYDALYGFASVLLALVGIASVLVIANAFSISTSERGRQFGLLKSAGATKAQIRNIVLFEGAILGLLSIPLGIAGGLAAQWVALSIANKVIGSIKVVHYQADFRVVFSPVVLFIAVAAAAVTILLAAWFPAIKAARVSPVEAIRQTSSIQIRPRSLRISPMIANLFGFPGVLAAKTMKRNRSKYRTTVLSLVVSIVLFIGASSFVQMLLKSTSMVYADIGSNVRIILRGEDEELQNQLAAELTALEGTKLHSSRQLHGTVTLPEAALTSLSVEHFGIGERAAVLYSLDDENFRAVYQALRINSAALEEPSDPQGILINTIGTLIRKGRRTSFVPYSIKTGTVVPIHVDDLETPIALLGQTGEVPPAIFTQFNPNGFSLIVSEQLLHTLQTENASPELYIAAMAEDPNHYAEQAAALLADRMERNTYSITNYEALAANNRGISLLVMIFAYGFIGLLSLIGITNVITTISTGIALRRREFAMLRSVGMTDVGIAKMLNLESLFYGVKSLLMGIPLGLSASYLMYLSLGGAMEFEFIWPTSSMLLCGAAVMLLTLFTMTFARRKQRRDNIVGALRDEIV